MKKNYLGIDLGGTNTKIGIGTMDGELLAKGSVATNVEEGPDAWVKRVVAKVREWNLDFESVGIGSPGPLDTKTGTILQTPNLQQFKGFSMRPAYENALGKPCRFENDANCAALGEFYFGAQKGFNDMVVLTLGTGVGSGVMSEGNLVRGAKGFATEMGHMVIDYDGPLCKCGKKGCFEAFVGARNTRDRYRKMTGLEEPQLTMREIFKRATLDSSDRLNKLALQIFEEWTFALAVGLANTISIFNPDVIILTGGITEAWPQIRPTLERDLKPMVEPHLMNSTLIEISKLGQYFGVHGAIALAAETRPTNR